MNRVSILLAASVVVLAQRAAGDGLIVIHNHDLTTSETPQHRPPHRFAPLEIRQHHVSVRIDDQVAVTEVDQTFYNPYGQQLEGTYLFPIPAGAQIDQFAMDIDGKTTEAELLDADKARQIYEDIVRKAKDPALLEYAGRGLFKVRIFPIEARNEKRVKLRYTQLLREDSGLVAYTYPLNTEKFSAAPLKHVSVKVEVQSAGGIKTVYSPSHAVEVTRPTASKAVIGFEAREVRPDTDFQLFFARETDSGVGLRLLTYNTGEKDGGYFLLLATPAMQTPDGAALKKDVVFVVDTSGSMAEGDKISQAQRALRFCLKNLNAGDRFEIVRFATEAQPLFSGLVDASAANAKKAEEFVDGLKPIGGTAIADALTKALDPLKKEGQVDRPYFVVFLTDGRPTVGVTNEDQILAGATAAMKDRAVRVFCFGVGHDVNTFLLDQLAEKTRAVSEYVLPGEDMEVKVSRFYSKINQPALANVQLNVGGDIRPGQMYPSELPDLFKGEQLLLLGRYQQSGDAAITLKGTVNGQAQSFVYEGKFASSNNEHAFIPRLWATRRVGFLLDQIRLNGETSELRDEVTLLARRHGIVTPYTAYLIVEDESRRGVPVTRQNLSRLGGNERAKNEAGRVYRDALGGRSGGEAVGNAQSLRTLKSADNAAAPGQSNVYAIRKGALAAPEPATDAEGVELQLALEQQPVKHVGGRAFFQNGAAWVDSEAQAREGAKAVNIKFDTDEYYSLLKRDSRAAQWLALGRNVQFVLDDTVYVVTE